MVTMRSPTSTRLFMPAALATCVALAHSAGPVIIQQASGTTSRLQALSPVSDRVAWASGTGGTYVVTTDGGDHWRAGVVPGADSLEFRDVAALDSATVWLLASGPGARSRIYRTTDGGATWALQFTNSDSLAFFDCFSFWDRARGLAVSDAVRGHFPILRTEDGGAHWIPLPQGPGADSGEGAFAASGTCLITGADGKAWIGTGASPGGGGRVLRSLDYGETWTWASTPVQHGTATSGITSLAFRDATHGFAGGGDIGPRAPQTVRVARTGDGGRTWSAMSSPAFAGGIYGLSLVPGLSGALVAVGPGGAAVSLNDGAEWAPLDSAGYWAAGFASPRAGWLVGPRGRIARVSF